MELRPTDALHLSEQPFEVGAAIHRPVGGTVDAVVGRNSFWDKYPGLIWSNRNADDAVHIRAALMRPFFPVLLDIAGRFGLPRLKHEWAVLCADPEIDTGRVEPIVSRILANLQRGYEQATA